MRYTKKLCRFFSPPCIGYRPSERTTARVKPTLAVIDRLIYVQQSSDRQLQLSHSHDDLHAIAYLYDKAKQN